MGGVGAELRSMRVNADNAKSEKKLVEATIGQIEADAAKQYAKVQRHTAPPARLLHWLLSRCMREWCAMPLAAPGERGR